MNWAEINRVMKHPGEWQWGFILATLLLGLLASALVWVVLAIGFNWYNIDGNGGPDLANHYNHDFARFCKAVGGQATIGDRDTCVAIHNGKLVTIFKESATN